MLVNMDIGSSFPIDPYIKIKEIKEKQTLVDGVNYISLIGVPLLA